MASKILIIEDDTTLLEMKVISVSKSQCRSPVGMASRLPLDSPRYLFESYVSLAR